VRLGRRVLRDRWVPRAHKENLERKVQQALPDSAGKRGRKVPSAHPVPPARRDPKVKRGRPALTETWVRKAHRENPVLQDQWVLPVRPAPPVHLEQTEIQVRQRASVLLRAVDQWPAGKTRCWSRSSAPAARAMVRDAQPPMQRLQGCVFVNERGNEVVRVVPNRALPRTNPGTQGIKTRHKRGACWPSAVIACC
jgi:hypothetical protein